MEPVGPPTFREALARLRSAQKPRARTPLYLRYVNRRLGGWLAAAGLARGATPDQLTAVSAVLSLAGIALLAAFAPGWPLGAAVAVLLLAGYAFDSADGQLARLRGGGSPAGEWLDHVVDAARTCLLHAGVAVGLYRFAPQLPRAVLLLPLLYVTAAVTLSFATMLRDQLLRAAPAVPAAPGGASLLNAVALAPIDFGTLALAFVLYGSPIAFVWTYGALTALHVAFLLRLTVRTHHALAVLRPPLP